jgi:tetratricopeptide (TPR) repeat protein
MLQRRAAWLEKDLLLAPEQPVLLAAAAETALALSRVHQPASPPLAEHWRQEGRRYADRLRAVNPELYPPFRQALEDPRGTVWGPPGSGNLVGSSPLTRGDRAYRVLVESGTGPVMASAVAQVSPLSGSSEARRAPAPLPPAFPMPGYPPLGNYPGGGAGLVSPGAPMAPVLTIPNTPSAAAAYALGAPLSELEGPVEARPYSASAAAHYAQALEARAEIDVRELPVEERKAALRARLEEAGRMYEKAARNARLRTYRASFLCSAGDVYRRAQAHELQYAVLRRAAREAPVSAPIWRELQQACLRTDRRKESEEAWREFQQWSLPVLRLTY